MLAGELTDRELLGQLSQALRSAHLRLGEHSGRGARRPSRQGAHRAAAARAGGGAGPALRKAHLRAARHPDHAVRGGGFARIAGARGASRSACPACSRRAAWATTARGSSCCANRRTSIAPGTRWASAPLLYENLVPFDAEVSIIAVRGARRRSRVLSTQSQRASRRHPAPHARAVWERRAHAARRNARRASCSSTSSTSACSPSSSSSSAASSIANEMAPRVHNSGHWTIEGADTSQFENHVRAIAGLPLGSTRARGHSAMINLVGEMPARDALLAEPALHWHDYGKTARPGRKLGHVTICETRRKPATGGLLSSCPGSTARPGSHFGKPA